MRDGTKDLVLVIDMVDLLGFDDFLLLHNLDAGVAIGAALFSQSDLSEGT